MGAFIEEIRGLIGDPPIGYEWLEYVVVAVLLIFLVDAAVALLGAVFKWIGGN